MKNSSSNDSNRLAIKDEIKRCAQGLKIKYQKELAVVENLGENINTRFDEFASVESPNDSDKLYFSSARTRNLGGLRDEEGKLDNLKGKYSSDIFSIILQNGTWTNPKRLSNLLNSTQNDVILDFNEDGSAMLLFKGFDFFSGQILVDSFKPIEDKPIYPNRFQSSVVAERGDASPYFFNDSTLIFSSRIEGGFGGSDLYISQKSKGKWCPPLNLGNTINSAYDESTPFLAEDGRTLYFSSNTTKGIGGFDIYKASFNDFKKEILLPYKQSSLGPFITKGDANGDGIDDLYIGGAHNQSGALYIKKNNSYVKMNSKAFKEDSEYEDMEALFVDIDSDGDNDLYVISGGSCLLYTSDAADE